MSDLIKVSIPRRKARPKPGKRPIPRHRTANVKRDLLSQADMCDESCEIVKGTRKTQG